MTSALEVKLGDVAEFIRGINFKPDDVVPLGTEGSVGCMRTKNVQDELDLSDVWAVSKEFVRREEQILAEGDILVSSANSWNLVGKCSWIPKLEWPSSFGGFVSVLRAEPEKVEPRFLYHWFSWERTQALLRSFGQKTTNISNLNIDRCLNMKLGLPSLPEQRRIAAILDKTDALRAKRREALAQLDSLTQSIFIEMFGDPSAKTPGFAKHQLQELIENGFQNGAYFPKEFYDEDGIEMVHMSDAFGGIIKRGCLKRVSCGQSDIEKYSLTIDDIIIARRSLTYDGAARPCMVPKADEPLIFESSFIRVRADKTRMSPLFLFHYLNNDRVREKFVRPYVTQSTISGINQSNLAKVPVVLPPIALQEEFKTRVTAIESVRKGFVESEIKLNSLFSSLQHRAFLGEL